MSDVGGQFDDADIVESYERQTQLFAAEEVLFERFIPAGRRVLDLGVGAGRTTAALAPAAARYVGIDLAPTMVAAAREACPGVDLRVGDAADLSAFDDASFDVVVFSYNGIDYLHPDEARWRCLDEVHRVLVEDGVLILSTHDPRGMWARVPKGSGPKGFAVAAIRIARRARERFLSRALWRGEGWVFDRVGPGFETHMAIPKVVIAETEARGFTHLETRSGDANGGGAWSTTWWYYAFRRATVEGVAVGSADADDRAGGGR